MPKTPNTDRSSSFSDELSATMESPNTPTSEVYNVVEQTQRASNQEEISPPPSTKTEAKDPESSGAIKSPVVLTTQFPDRSSSEEKQPPPAIFVQRLSPMLVNQREPFPVRLATNVEVDRLQLIDVAERKRNQLSDALFEELLEEVIQSDFEKPSIPEVILSVITDLTNDDESDDFVDDELYDDQSVYYFKPVTESNGNIDHYYNTVRQAVTNTNGNETLRIAQSPDQNFTLMPSNTLQVKRAAGASDFSNGEFV